MKKKIEKCLNAALLLDGEMEIDLYKYELEEHIDYWKTNLKKDKNNFVFVLTVNKGDVAMVLITDKDELYINEQAREHLQSIWEHQYENNIRTIMHTMVNFLANDCLAVMGITTV